jgi:hypothetical protein
MFSSVAESGVANPDVPGYLLNNFVTHLVALFLMSIDENAGAVILEDCAVRE